LSGKKEVNTQANIARDVFLGPGAEASLTPHRSSKCNTDFTVILEFTMECVTQTIAKIKDKFQTALQCKINTTDHRA
jgi:hypothetical protein